MKFAITTIAILKLKENIIFFDEPNLREMNLWTQQSTKEQTVAPIATLTMLFIFSLIIISYVETRWFSNVLVLLPIVFVERIYKFKTTYNLSDNFDFFVINLQLLSLTFMSLPYLFKNLNLLF